MIDFLPYFILASVAFYFIGQRIERTRQARRQIEIDRLSRRYRPAADRYDS